MDPIHTWHGMENLLKNVKLSPYLIERKLGLHFLTETYRTLRRARRKPLRDATTSALKERKPQQSANKQQTVKRLNTE